ncbi:hypothetical protein ACK3TF_005952 [Chlorella vulgaris]
MTPPTPPLLRRQVLSIANVCQQLAAQLLLPPLEAGAQVVGGRHQHAQPVRRLAAGTRQVHGLRMNVTQCMKRTYCQVLRVHGGRDGDACSGGRGSGETGWIGEHCPV